MADKGKSLSTEMAVRNESPSDEEAEALARRVMARAASLT